MKICGVVEMSDEISISFRMKLFGCIMGSIRERI